MRFLLEHHTKRSEIQSCVIELLVVTPTAVLAWGTTLSALYWRAWITACALVLAGSTLALADNTKAENDAANAAVMYLTASKKCNNLSAIQLGALKTVTDQVLAETGITWEHLQSGQKPIVECFLKEHDIYEKMLSGDEVTIDSMCGIILTVIDKPVLKPKDGKQ